MLNCKCINKDLLKHVILILCLIFVSSPLTAEFYEWTDSNGVKHYTQEPPPEEESISDQKIYEEVETNNSNGGFPKTGDQAIYDLRTIDNFDDPAEILKIIKVALENTAPRLRHHGGAFIPCEGKSPPRLGWPARDEAFIYSFDMQLEGTDVKFIYEFKIVEEKKDYSNYQGDTRIHYYSAKDTIKMDKVTITPDNAYFYAVSFNDIDGESSIRKKADRLSVKNEAGQLVKDPPPKIYIYSGRFQTSWFKTTEILFRDEKDAKLILNGFLRLQKLLKRGAAIFLKSEAWGR